MALPSPSRWIPEQNLKRLAVLGKLIEELCEAGARAARCIIQGIDESDPKTRQINREALQEEIADVIALAHVNIKFFDLDKDAIMRRAVEKEEHKEAWIALLDEDGPNVITYPALISENHDPRSVRFTMRFPDISDAPAYGNSLTEVMHNGKEALRRYVAHCVTTGTPLATISVPEDAPDDVLFIPVRILITEV